MATSQRDDEPHWSQTGRLLGEDHPELSPEWVANALPQSDSLDWRLKFRFGFTFVKNFIIIAVQPVSTMSLCSFSILHWRFYWFFFLEIFEFSRNLNLQTVIFDTWQSSPLISYWKSSRSFVLLDECKCNRRIYVTIYYFNRASN